MTGMEPWLIVGLGNPDKEYENTRHNVGRATVELMARESGVKFSRHRSQTMFARATVGSPGSTSRVILAYSRTYMNISGPPIVGLAKTEGIPADRILVLHDDLDLPAHTLRLKSGGGSGGHNGIKSIAAALKSQDFDRLRIGIGRPPGNMDPARYVLAQISGAERTQWDVTYNLAAESATDVVLQGFVKAQMDLHSKESR